MGRGGGRWSPTGPGSGRTGSTAGTSCPETQASVGSRRKKEHCLGKSGKSGFSQTFNCNSKLLAVYITLEGATRYAGLLLAPAEGFGLRPRAFLPFGQTKSLFHAVFAYFRPFLVFSSNIGNFENNPKNPKKNPKNSEKFKFLKSNKKISKNP